MAFVPGYVNVGASESAHNIRPIYNMPGSEGFTLTSPEQAADISNVTIAKNEPTPFSLFCFMIFYIIKVSWFWSGMYSILDTRQFRQYLRR